MVLSRLRTKETPPILWWQRFYQLKKPGISFCASFFWAKGVIEKTEMHSHPDVVAYTVAGGKARFEFPGGHSMDIDSKPGEAMFMDGHSHSAENTGDSELHAILIELK